MNALLTTLYLDNTRVDGLLFSTPCRCLQFESDLKCVQFHEDLSDSQEYKYECCPYGYSSCKVKVNNRTAFVCGMNVKGVSPKHKHIDEGLYIPAITEDRAVNLAKQNVEFLQAASEAQRLSEFIPTLVHSLTKLLGGMRSNGEFLLQKCANMIDGEVAEKLASIAVSTIAAETVFYADRMQALNSSVGSPRSIDVYGKFFKMKKILLNCRRKSCQIELKGSVHYKYGLFVSFEIAVYQLLENAIKYTPANKTIKVTFLEDDSGLAILIENVGPYVSKKELKKIREFRVRGENAEKYTQTGSGIGLASVANIAEVNGFDFDIDSSSKIDCVLEGVKFSKFSVRLKVPMSLRREEKD